MACTRPQFPHIDSAALVASIHSVAPLLPTWHPNLAHHAVCCRCILAGCCLVAVAVCCGGRCAAFLNPPWRGCCRPMSGVSRAARAIVRMTALDTTPRVTTNVMREQECVYWLTDSSCEGQGVRAMCQDTCPSWVPGRGSMDICPSMRTLSGDGSGARVYILACGLPRVLALCPGARKNNCLYPCSPGTSPGR